MTQVLVVDDEAAMRTALEANFLRDGWAVDTASGATEALAKFRGAPCPLVVTDMRMPDGDGMSVLQGVREIAPETAVVFLTAFGSIPEAVLTMKEGRVRLSGQADFVRQAEAGRASRDRELPSAGSAAKRVVRGHRANSSPETLRHFDG